MCRSRTPLRNIIISSAFYDSEITINPGRFTTRWAARGIYLPAYYTYIHYYILFIYFIVILLYYYIPPITYYRCSRSGGAVVFLYRRYLRSCKRFTIHYSGLSLSSFAIPVYTYIYIYRISIPLLPIYTQRTRIFLVIPRVHTYTCVCV